jgi:hypothetical protein
MHSDCQNIIKIISDISNSKDIIRKTTPLYRKSWVPNLNGRSLWIIMKFESMIFIFPIKKILNTTIKKTKKGFRNVN